jgi:hypothetical protein
MMVTSNICTDVGILEVTFEFTVGSGSDSAMGTPCPRGILFLAQGSGLRVGAIYVRVDGKEKFGDV